MYDNPDKTHDVFLSHSHEDAEMVKLLARKLKTEKGFKVWLDQWEMIPGEPFVSGLQKGLVKSKTCAIIFGQRKPKGWVLKEIHKAINLQAQNENYRVMAVLLPGAIEKNVDDFVGLNTWINFNTSIDEKRAFHLLCCGIKGVAPGDLFLDDENSTTKTRIKGALTLIPRPTTVIGREVQLEAIKTAFNEKKEIILVNGLGGIGKTTVALEYAWQQNNFDHVAWLEITDKIPDAFINSTLLKNSLKVNELLSQVPPTQLSTQGFELILDAMNQLPGDNLLILDNANNHDELMAQMEYLQSLHWKILFTSRIDSHLLEGDLHSISIDELSLPDAVLLFKEHFDVEAAQQSLVEALVKNLHHHTLLIEMVARAAKQQKIALPDLAEMVQEAFIHHEKLNEEAIRTGKYAGGKGMPKIDRITLYIQKFFQEITELTEREKQYLRYFCLLPSNDYTKEELIDFFQVEEETNRNFNDVLSALIKKGLLSYKDTEEKNTYKLHALVQDVAVRDLKPDAENCEIVIKTFIDKLRIDQAKDNPVDKFKWIPFGERIVELIKSLTYGEIIELFHWLAFNYMNTGQYQKSKDLLEPSHSIVEQHFGDTHARTAVFQNDLGWTYNLLGKYNEASLQLGKALDSDIKEYGENHAGVAITRSNLGVVYLSLGKYGKAQGLLTKALTSDQENFGVKHPKVATRQSNLAMVYRELGEYEKAGDLMEKALASDLENFGTTHPKVAIRQSNLALVYQQLKDYGKARELYESALASDLENFGAKHPNIASYQFNLGVLYFYMDEKTTAKDYFQKAYDLSKELLGDSHPHTKAAKEWLDKVC
ncbi:MAG: tetratricopeptide (TPR) repeat protein [Saprospiraceae bacterium]|jgi:tetratricopeptide (TPR) repeat protein